MSNHPDIDPRREAEITKRLGQAFDFIRDAIESPQTLENIPDGSRLAFRDTEAAGYLLRLTAARRPDGDAEWTARITGYAKTPETPAGGKLQIDFAAVETGATAEAALDALVACIHRYWQGERAVEALR
jgi:hypothetical protein